MKTIAKIMTIFGFLALFGTAWANEPIIPGAISHWKFDEGTGTIAYDSAGSNDGNIMGDPNWVIGKIGGALSFDGDGDYVATANNIFTNTQLASGATLSAWFKTSSTATCYIADDEGYLALGINHSTHPNKLLGTADGGNHKYYSSSDVNDNLWHHAAIVWNGAGTAILYLDGFEESSGPSGSPKPDLQNRPFAIGVHSSISAYFDGLIDDVRVYDKALSAVEVWRLWSSDPVPPLIELSATRFEFTAFEGGANPNDQILGISNGGEVTLNWQITEDCNWLSANPNAGSSTGEVDDVNLSVDISGLAAGTYTCELMISDPNALNNPQIVGITLYVGDNDGQLHVPSEYSTIQAAIDVAVTGDTVLVAPGTYTGPGNRDIQFLGKAITVRSENGLENCIIDCNGTEAEPHRGFYFNSGEDTNSILTGFTITKGFSWYGGAISCVASSSPTITNCTITDNCADEGGGIYCYGSNLTITNCIISGNSAKEEHALGGGINCRRGSPIITNCTIIGNTAGLGGGIHCFGGSPTITNCTLNGNSAERGGAIYSVGSPTLTNCILYGDTGMLGHEMYLIEYGNVSVSYSDISDGPNDIYVEPPVNLNWGPGNINLDPALAFNTDYHLMPDSPCIDAGDPNYSASPEETDLDGNPRILDGNADANAVIDMGAYEFNPDSPSIAVSAASFYFIHDWPDTAPQTLSIRNCGGGILNWEIIEDCNWLEFTPPNGVSTNQINEVTLTVDPNGLTPGIYNCIFEIQDPNASNSPVTVQVEFRVRTILRVPSQDYPAIQDGIDAADDYDMVLVADGTYTGTGNRDIDFLGKAITVRSESGPENCIIDCNGTLGDEHRGFYFNSGEDTNSVLAGFIITNGFCYDGSAILCEGSSPTINNCVITNNTADQGGGIYCQNSRPIITNCNITGNSARLEGGGIYSYSDSLVINNCTITSNKASSGGGIFCNRSNPTITNCTISDNSAESWKGGGGIYCKYSNAIISDCTIIGNTTEGLGAGIHCEYSSPMIYSCTISGNTGGGGISCQEGSPIISNCDIIGNTTEGSGGGIHCRDSSPIITNCTISNNSAGERFLGGGGIHCGHSSSPTITNCIISGNSAESRGGGIYCYIGSSPTINNCTVTGNKAGYKGGGIHCFGGSSTITNCIFWDNEALYGPEICLGRTSSIWVNYTDVQGGRDDVYIGPYSTLNWNLSNIDTDPCFFLPGYWADANDPNIIVEPNDPNAVWLEGDYHLVPDSLCIDTGDPNYIPSPNETDLDGNPRVIGYAVDMGAYETNYIEAEMNFTPKTINCNSKGNWVKAHLTLPDEFLPEDVDVNTPAWAEPLNLESEYIKLLGGNPVKLEIAFDRQDFCDAITEPGQLEVTIIGSLTTGQNFFATDSIKIIHQR